MPEAQRLQITLDLEDGPDQPHGTVLVDAVAVQAFWGWLQLIQAIEAAIAASGTHEVIGQTVTDVRPQSD